MQGDLEGHHRPHADQETALSARTPHPALVAAASFVAGFGVADLTGVRALGGLVLLAGGVWCARAVAPVAGRGRTAALMLFALAMFVASHPLGDAIGAWPAVLLVATLVGAVTAALVAPRSPLVTP